MPPVIAFIADTASANGKGLLELLKELDGRATCITGNDVATFQSSDRLSEVDVIVPSVFAGGNPKMIAELWPLCPQVRWVHSMSAGVDNIVPVLNSLPRGPETPLTNAKGAFSRSLAEYALAAMLHFNKQIVRLQRQRVECTWEKFIMADVYGKTAGFVGFGDIAQTTARLCKAFGMRIIALRNTPGASGSELADAVHYGAEGKLEVFRQSDFVVCTLPGGPATDGFCGKAEFAAMRSTAVFVSMGRGTCVDEEALVEALKSGSIAGAALDVFATEPLPPTSPLWACENLLISPHNADLTVDYMRLTWDVFVAKLGEYADPNFSGFADTVDKSKGY